MPPRKFTPPNPTPGEETVEEILARIHVQVAFLGIPLPPDMQEMLDQRQREATAQYNSFARDWEEGREEGRQSVLAADAALNPPATEGLAPETPEELRRYQRRDAEVLAAYDAVAEEHDPDALTNEELEVLLNVELQRRSDARRVRREQRFREEAAAKDKVEGEGEEEGEEEEEANEGPPLPTSWGPQPQPES